MREMIAMLDGYGLGSFVVEPGNGQNYVGGATYPDEGGFPTLVSGSYGLASFVVEPGNGQNYVGGATYPDEGGFPTLVSGSYGLAAAHSDAQTLAGYMAAFSGASGTRVATIVEPGNGQNYVGGATYPDQGGFPTLVSGSYGLAGVRTRAALQGASLAGASRRGAASLGRVARGLSGIASASPQAHAYAAAFMAARKCGKSPDAARQIALNVSGSF